MNDVLQLLRGIGIIGLSLSLTIGLVIGAAKIAGSNSTIFVSIIVGTFLILLLILIRDSKQGGQKE